ncbi:hypothetical protein QUC32_02850 [Novosphingobium resinovorum]|nr:MULTISPECIES: hypothetical protein [Novosphingobium]WJM25915.1 hypothetical protein QUC32_02850 [Novosphingobium resinovorum]
MSRPRFDIEHVPDTWPDALHHWEDQLYIGAIDLLVLGNTDGPA